MTAPALHRLPAPLEAAIQRLKLTVRAAATRTVDAFGLGALSAANAQQRDRLLEAQFELNRRHAAFVLAFNEAYDERVLRESTQRGEAAAAPAAAAASRWEALTLVENRELEQQVAAERFGLEIGHACEAELRELAGYVGALLPAGLAGSDRHPLRPELVGHALLRGVDVVSERAEVRKLLQSELVRALSGVMQSTYAEIVADLRAAGVQQASLNVRMNGARAGADSRSGALAAARQAAAEQAARAAPPGPSWPAPAMAGAGGRGARRGATPMGEVDAQLMTLIRRLAHFGPGVAADSGGGGVGSFGSASRPSPLPPNLIHAHRDELRQASTGALDHMVIDVIGTLFDAILSDPKVPPQMARQIARLQLPVLRAALGDPGFFSSRKHPVRRFVNRIASLGAAVDDFADADAQRFLALVRELVQQIVDGDFENVELYEQKLAVLERFVAEQTQQEAQDQGDPAALLAEKEEALRQQHHYALLLQRELAPAGGPDFLRQFLADTWSRVLVRVARQDGAGSERLRRLRLTARELFMSVQPKGTPAQRKAFVALRPQLMRELDEGLGLIGWPEAQRKALLAQLLAAQAESMKGQGLQTLRYNLLARQVDDTLALPIPSAAELPPPDTTVLPVLADAVDAPSFSADEARRVGLVEEAKVDWDGKIDVDLGAEPALQAADIRIEGLPAPEPVEPMHGAELAGHVQVGCAYQMHLEGEWQKVRLTHISAARSFFVFTRGKRHKQAISLTARMLVKMCEAGRLRAFENAYLLERATVRARRQLAGVGAGVRA